MTALALRPMSRTSDPASFHWNQRDDLDRSWLRRALSLAALLHLLVVALPLPEPARPEQPSKPPRDPFKITSLPIPPPERRPREIEHRDYSRRMPLPFAETADLEPLDEPAPNRELTDRPSTEVELLLVEPVAPPQPEFYEENTEGLVLPVRLAGVHRSIPGSQS